MLQNTTKEAFCDRCGLVALQLQQFFTHHHATKVVKTKTYQTKHEHFYDFSLNKGAPLMHSVKPL
jgi:hypothetical protein